MDHVLPETALKLREIGFPQGNTKYLWHRRKGAKVSLPAHNIVAGEEHWHIYKRNKHDISAFGDSHGYNRWVSAPTIEQVREWMKQKKEDIWEENRQVMHMVQMAKFFASIIGVVIEEREMTNEEE